MARQAINRGALLKSHDLVSAAFIFGLEYPMGCTEQALPTDCLSVLL
ncbi:MAG: hypothetical protein KUG76_06980 [Gammaproteobacteria bacterium]|nr:hypothetical protein [Gammaproteobacteria bacterium]